MSDPPPPADPPTHSFEAHAAARLLDERAVTLARMDQLNANFETIVAAATDTSTDDEHDPEGQTIAFERSQVMSLLSQAVEHLSRLDHATERLSAGQYQLCARCGQPIGEERLAARPTSTTCIECASRKRR